MRSYWAWLSAFLVATTLVGASTDPALPAAALSVPGQGKADPLIVEIRIDGSAAGTVP
jgi:hypothetical protein